VAVLFADVIGFTRLSEQQAPEQVIGLLRELHGRLEAAVFEHEATLDKYLGDGVMATFGRPRHSPCEAAGSRSRSGGCPAPIRSGPRHAQCLSGILAVLAIRRAVTARVICSCQVETKSIRNEGRR